MNPAPNLILVGPTGAGKTSIGKRVAERFGSSGFHGMLLGLIAATALVSAIFFVWMRATLRELGAAPAGLAPGGIPPSAQPGSA